MATKKHKRHKIGGTKRKRHFAEAQRRLLPLPVGRGEGGERGWRGSEVRGKPASTPADIAPQKSLEVPRNGPPLSLDPSPHPMGRGKRRSESKFHSTEYSEEPFRG